MRCVRKWWPEMDECKHTTPTLNVLLEWASLNGAALKSLRRPQPMPCNRAARHGANRHDFLNPASNIRNSPETVDSKHRGSHDREDRPIQCFCQYSVCILSMHQVRCQLVVPLLAYRPIVLLRSKQAMDEHDCISFGICFGICFGIVRRLP